MKAGAGKNEEWRLQGKSHAKEGETPEEVTAITVDSSLLGCYAVSTSHIPRNLNHQQHPPATAKTVFIQNQEKLCVVKL
jgi:hypothetical protein